MKNIKDIYPLSPLQYGLLFRDLYENKKSTKYYLTQKILEIEGAIDTAILNKAWQIICNQHDILRTGFIWEDLDEPLQYILEDTEIYFQNYYWENHENLQNKLNTFLKQDLAEGIDLTKVPLFRVALISLPYKKHFMIWTTHHIILDGWCSNVILEEVFYVYKCLVTNDIFNLKKRPSFATYIDWLQRQNKGKAIKFWQNYLKGLDEPTIISLKHLRSSNNQFLENEHFLIGLESRLTAQINNYAQYHNLTVNTIIQGALGIVLGKYIGKQNLSYGITTSGRSIDLEGVENIIGIFINTLPLRIHLQPNTEITNYLLQLQNSTQDINENSYISLAEVQKLALTEGGSLFNVILVFENYPKTSNTPKLCYDLEVKNSWGTGNTEYPLTLIVVPDKNIYFKVKYHNEHFTKQIVERFCNHVINVIKQLVLTKNHLKIGHIIVLDEPEKNQLIKWNNTKEKFIGPNLVHAVFEEQVKKYPDKIALKYQKQEITYNELNTRSNSLSHYLQKSGAGPEMLVAIALKRNIKMVISVLAVLKVGAGYLPIELNHPDERIKYLLKDSGVKILITEASLISRFKEFTTQVIIIDNHQSANESNLQVKVDEENIASVIYTSGSTGKPKGVIIKHSSIVNYINSIKVYLKGEELGYLNTLTADLGNTILFGALLLGKKLNLVDQAIDLDSQKIVKFIKQDQIDLIKITPSYYKMLADDLSDYKKIRLILGGEPFFNNTNFTIVNHYGPTETTIGVTTYQGNKQTEMPIGKPLSNIRIYILDKNLDVIPIGCIGEICVEGKALARGYINKADITAEKFIASPFTKGERLYRTGDLGRYLKDGNIEYIGRLDELVKIRGFRVEIGEIEHTLRLHENILNCAVIFKRELIAYIIPDQKIINTLRVKKKLEHFNIFYCSLQLTNLIDDYLRVFLPSYMIPGQYIFVSELPLNSNFKINKRVLYNIEVGHKKTYDRPRDYIEKKLCRIWQDILDFKKVGINDNFFKLGGDSLVSIKLVSKARKEGFKLEVKDLFNNPTVASLAKLMKAESEKPSVVPILPITINPNSKYTLFIIHPGGGLANIYLKLKEYVPSISIYGLNNPYFYYPDKVKSIKEIAPLYINEIKKIQKEGPYIIAGYSHGGVIAYEVSSQMQTNGNLIEKLILIDYVPKVATYTNNSNKNYVEMILSEDKELNKYLNLNLKHSINLRKKYKFEPIDIKTFLLKCSDNEHLGYKEIFFDLCKNGTKLVIPGSHDSLFEEAIQTTAFFIKKVILSDF